MEIKEDEHEVLNGQRKKGRIIMTEIRGRNSEGPFVEQKIKEMLMEWRVTKCNCNELC